jgi:hypothetical protein
MPSRESDAHYYQDFLAEREEIRSYKWIESQKAKHDIGFEQALLEWTAHHRALWRREKPQHEKAGED